MAKAELKTKPTNSSVAEFVASISDQKQRADSEDLLKMMEEISGDKGKMWGTGIVGFCDVHLKYESGRELDWFKIGFAPRKGNLSLYGLKKCIGDKDELLEVLGKCKDSVGCIYIKSLADIDTQVLKKMVKRAVS